MTDVVRLDYLGVYSVAQVVMRVVNTVAEAMGSKQLDTENKSEQKIDIVGENGTMKHFCRVCL